MMTAQSLTLTDEMIRAGARARADAAHSRGVISVRWDGMTDYAKDEQVRLFRAGLDATLTAAGVAVEEPREGWQKVEYGFAFKEQGKVHYVGPVDRVHAEDAVDALDDTWLVTRPLFEPAWQAAPVDYEMGDRVEQIRTGDVGHVSGETVVAGEPRIMVEFENRTGFLRRNEIRPLRKTE